MNKNTLTSGEIALRGLLSVALGVFAFLLSTPDYREMVGPAVFLATGTINAALLALRLFIDKSTSQGQVPVEEQEPVPVTVENSEYQPVPTVETKE